MIVELCRRAGVQPHQVIKIGDTPADIQEGQSAQVGLNVGVTYGTHTREQLLPFGPDKLIDSLDELLEFCS
jgi:phosphoglycolate phosphatase-like HAD superfamily hydrolase